MYEELVEGSIKVGVRADDRGLDKLGGRKSHRALLSVVEEAPNDLRQRPLPLLAPLVHVNGLFPKEHPNTLNTQAGGGGLTDTHIHLDVDVVINKDKVGEGVGAVEEGFSEAWAWKNCWAAVPQIWYSPGEPTHPKLRHR